jgi:predicted RNase H-like HicB family nuclease
MPWSSKRRTATIQPTCPTSGCVATGATVAEVEAEIREAIRFHIDGLKTDGLDVPAPTSIAEYVEA